MIPPNTSSDETGAAVQAAAADISALVGGLAAEFGADLPAFRLVAALFEAGRKRAPDTFLPAPGGLASALAAVAADGDVQGIYAALGEWALDAEGEPLERLRRDCLRMQSALTRTALRVYADDAGRCADSLLALQRYIFLQVAVLLSLTARGQAEGGVVRTLPTPEYAAFMEILRTTIENHRHEGRQLGLLLLEIGRIEQVDRLLSMQKGEAFMLRVARRMREGVLRKQDLLGRVSRDQFACLLPRIAGEGVAILAANKLLDALRAPIPLGDREFDADAAIGIALYPEHGTDPQTLVRSSKLAAGAARGASERIALCDPLYGASEERSVQYESRLRHALEQGALAIVFAPQVDLASGRPTALASMLRWNDAELGEVAEARAIEAAESAGLIRELTWWTYNNALRLSAELTRAGIDLPVGLTVTASALMQPDFADFVGRALRTWNVVPGRVTIEVHESALAGALEPLKEVLARLKALGVRLAIGGFGAASSSLPTLAELPLDEAKIGATFVTDMRRAVAHAKIVRSLAHLAQDLGLRVAAEGVEDAGTAAELAKFGCSRVQGGYAGRALTVQEILRCDLAATGPVRLPLEPKR